MIHALLRVVIANAKLEERIIIVQNGQAHAQLIAPLDIISQTSLKTKT